MFSRYRYRVIVNKRFSFSVSFRWQQFNNDRRHDLCGGLHSLGAF